MLLGEYSTNIGDKNRVTLPRKIQAELEGDSLIITRGYERSIILVDMERWQNLVKDINKRPLFNLSVRDTKRFLLGGAFQVDLDKQGRFVIPEALSTYAAIEKEISVIGVGEWLEIWSLQRWQHKLKQLADNSADVADRLSEITN